MLPRSMGLSALGTLLPALALSLASCGSSGGQHAAMTSTTRSTSSAQPLMVALHAPRVEPKAGGFWPIVVTARTSDGAPVDGTVSYAFLFGGSVVARRPGGQMRSGIFHDRLEFPAQAVGYPLTVQVIVQATGATGTTERSVTVRR